MLNVFDRIRGRQAEQERAVAMDYRELVRQVATGELTDPEAIDPEAFHRSVDDLQADVSRYQRCDELRAEVPRLRERIEDAKAAAGEIPALEAEIAEEKQRLAETLEARLETLKRAVGKQVGARSRLAEIEAELVELADPEERERLIDLRKQRREIIKSRGEIQAHIDRLRGTLANHDSDDDGEHERDDERRAELAVYEERCEQLKQQAHELEMEAKQASKEIANV